VAQGVGLEFKPQYRQKKKKGWVLKLTQVWTLLMPSNAYPAVTAE
jgi:hypothetical protein